MRTVVCRDLVLQRNGQHHPYYQSTARRFGVMVEPLVVVFVRALMSALSDFRCSAIVSVIFVAAVISLMFATKLLLGTLLLAHASRHLEKEYRMYKDGFDPVRLVLFVHLVLPSSFNLSHSHSTYLIPQHL